MCGLGLSVFPCFSCHVVNVSPPVCLSSCLIGVPAFILCVIPVCSQLSFCVSLSVSSVLIAFQLLVSGFQLNIIEACFFFF